MKPAKRRDLHPIQLSTDGELLTPVAVPAPDLQLIYQKVKLSRKRLWIAVASLILSFATFLVLEAGNLWNPTTRYPQTLWNYIQGPLTGICIFPIWSFVSMIATVYYWSRVARTRDPNTPNAKVAIHLIAMFIFIIVTMLAIGFALVLLNWGPKIFSVGP